MPLISVTADVFQDEMSYIFIALLALTLTNLHHSDMLLDDALSYHLV